MSKVDFFMSKVTQKLAMTININMYTESNYFTLCRRNITTILEFFDMLNNIMKLD